MKFRKRPVIIEAFQLDDNAMPKPDWAMSDTRIHYYTGGHALIDTLEGQMRADRCDWIVRGIKGELYPVKPDIFTATYEPV